MTPQQELEEQIVQLMIADPHIFLDTYENGDLVEPEQTISGLLALIEAREAKAGVKELQGLIAISPGNAVDNVVLKMASDRLAQLSHNTKTENER